MDRFEIVYSQGILEQTAILMDRDTGVNYLWHREGNSGGLTPLLKEDGTPVVTKGGGV